MIKRVIFLLCVGFCLLFFTASLADSVSVTAVVPDTHTITITIGEHGAARYGEQRFTETATLTVQRFAPVTIDIVPEDGYKLGGVRVSSGENLTYDGTSIQFSSVVEDVFVELSFEMDEQTALENPRIAYCSLVLGGVPTLRYYVQVPEGFAGTDAFMTFSLNRRNDRTAALSESRYVTTVNGMEINAYYFDCPVYAYQMADTITAVFAWTEGGTAHTVTDSGYSVQTYLNDIISADAGTYSSEAVALATAARNFGHCVQPYLAGLNGWTVGTEYAEITGASVDVGGAKSAVAAHAFTLGDSIPGLSLVKNVQYYLILTDSTTLHFTLQLKNAPEEAVTARLAVEGEETAHTAVTALGNNTYEVTVSGIAANNLDVKRHVEFFVGDTEVFDISASVLSYLNTMLSNAGASAEEQQALASMYYYWAAAEAYESAVNP